MENSAFLAFVEGIVQGVGFRYFAYREAQALNLCGYVRNLSDGRVEIYAEGAKSDIQEFIGILRVGPRFGNVEKLDIQWKEPVKKYSKFIIDSGYDY